MKSRKQATLLITRAERERQRERRRRRRPLAEQRGQFHFPVGTFFRGGFRQKVWKAAGQLSQHNNSPPSLHTRQNSMCSSSSCSWMPSPSCSATRLGERRGWGERETQPKGEGGPTWSPLAPATWFAQYATDQAVIAGVPCFRGLIRGCFFGFHLFHGFVVFRFLDKNSFSGLPCK